VLFTLSAHSTSVGFQVDSILENGDILVTQLDIRPGDVAPTEYLQVLVILEVSRDIMPDKFNVIIENRWHWL